MNIGNLKQMYNHMRTVPEERIYMMGWRKGSEKTHECESCGCIIGHCVILDEWENVPIGLRGDIDFRRWSRIFTEIEILSLTWSFLFEFRWSNNKSQILARMKYVIENQEIPQDWVKDNFKYEITDPRYLENIPYEI